MTNWGLFSVVPIGWVDGALGWFWWSLVSFRRGIFVFVRGRKRELCGIDFWVYSVPGWDNSPAYVWYGMNVRNGSISCWCFGVVTEYGWVVSTSAHDDPLLSLRVDMPEATVYYLV